MADPVVEQVRRFNRVVTERVGALNDEFPGRPRPLGEARLLWEIGLPFGLHPEASLNCRRHLHL